MPSFSPKTVNVASHLANVSLSSIDRLTIDYLVNAGGPITLDVDGKEVIEGLSKTPKSLPPKYFYDDIGSELFDQICDLPEYYPTRTEASILQTCATEIAQLTGACELVELGSGSANKTRILLDAYQHLGFSLRYLPIDISGGALEASAYSLLMDYPTLWIHGLVSTYELALAKLPARELPTRLICFLGSTLGNLSPQECDLFLNQVRTALQTGEFFLLGVDLQKPIEILEAAYNDQQGITAAFNLNLLNHLNWRFQGDFDTNQFEHVAIYNPHQHQIEMHLRSKIAQTVYLKRLNLSVQFTVGETIHSEISRKFDLVQMQATLAQHHLFPLQTWTDVQHWFGLILCRC